MSLSHEHVWLKILAKIKICNPTRAELLFPLCYEIPCSSFKFSGGQVLAEAFKQTAPFVKSYTNKYIMQHFHIQNSYLCNSFFQTIVRLLINNHIFWYLCSQHSFAMTWNKSQLKLNGKVKVDAVKKWQFLKLFCTQKRVNCNWGHLSISK